MKFWPVLTQKTQFRLSIRFFLVCPYCVLFLFIFKSEARSTSVSNRSFGVPSRVSNTLQPQQAIIVPELAGPEKPRIRRKSQHASQNKALRNRRRVSRVTRVVYTPPTPVQTENRDIFFTDAEPRVFDWLNQEINFDESVKGARRNQNFRDFAMRDDSFFG